MSKYFDAKLVAQCGMNCGTCVSFFGYTMAGKKRMHTCMGCRPRKSLCAFIKKGCKLIAEKKPVEFCFECSDFACENIVKIDTVYRKKYGMSLIENLNYIKEKGMDAFLEKEKQIRTCPNCGGVICIHTKRCYICNP